MTRKQRQAERKLQARVKGWCRLWAFNKAGDYRDECGDLNATRLAEDAACEFELYGPAPDYEIPDWLFVFTGELAEEGLSR